MALAYATSDRGGCHQRAWTVLGELDGYLPRFSTEGMAATVKTIQDERAAAYSLVVCDFAPYEQERALACLRHVTGWDITEEEYLAAGERTWNHTRLFNVREAGVSRKDDALPPRMLEDPLPMPPRGEQKVSLGRGELDKMLDEYYELRGWNRDGGPGPRRLRDSGSRRGHDGRCFSRYVGFGLGGFRKCWEGPGEDPRSEAGRPAETLRL